MCDFPSWIETDDGAIHYLTDKDAEWFLLSSEPPTMNDMTGHSGIRLAYPGLGGTDREGFPCPDEIMAAIRAGKMDEIAERSLLQLPCQIKTWPRDVAARVLTKGASSKNLSVRAVVAKSERTPPDILTRLLKDRDIWVRRAAYENSARPPCAIRGILARDSESAGGRLVLYIGTMRKCLSYKSGMWNSANSVIVIDMSTGAFRDKYDTYETLEDETPTGWLPDYGTATSVWIEG